MDVAFGGAFYAFLEDRVAPEELPRLIELGRAIKADLERDHEIVHPEVPELRDVYGVVFWQHEDDGPPLVQRNVTVFADGEVDRSPCGSATSARMALLDVPSCAISASSARSSAPGSSAGRRWPDVPAVITEVEGSAHRTGTHEFVLEPADELGTGFLLR